MLNLTLLNGSPAVEFILCSLGRDGFMWSARHYVLGVVKALVHLHASDLSAVTHLPLVHITFGSPMGPTQLYHLAQSVVTTFAFFLGLLMSGERESQLAFWKRISKQANITIFRNVHSGYPKG